MLSDDTITQEFGFTSAYINKPMVILRIPDKLVMPKGMTPLIDTKPPVNRKPSAKSQIDTKLLVNTKDLMQILSCGKPMAIKIGENAHAKICIGRKILWNVECVKKYLNSIAE